MNKTLLTPRIKALPKGLIYNAPKSDSYKLIDLKKKKVVGEMIAFPEKNSIRRIYDIPEEKNVFRIYSLEINYSAQRKGWGKFFINFAKKESYKTNCEGRLSLVAYNPFASPHLFYKKQGLKAKDKRIDDRLNSSLKKNQLWNGYPPCEMYLPVENNDKIVNPIKKNSLWNKIKSFFKLKTHR